MRSSRPRRAGDHRPQPDAWRRDAVRRHTRPRLRVWLDTGTGGRACTRRLSSVRRASSTPRTCPCPCPRIGLGERLTADRRASGGGRRGLRRQSTGSTASPPATVNSPPVLASTRNWRRTRNMAEDLLPAINIIVTGGRGFIGSNFRITWSTTTLRCTTVLDAKLTYAATLRTSPGWGFGPRGLLGRASAMELPDRDVPATTRSCTTPPRATTTTPSPTPSPSCAPTSSARNFPPAGGRPQIRCPLHHVSTDEVYGRPGARRAR